MAKPYILWFGKHKGKSLEQVFVTDYQYFRWLKKELEREDNQTHPASRFTLLAEINLLLEQASKKKMKIRCRCGKSANIILANGDYHTGYTFQAVCEDCERSLPGIRISPNIDSVCFFHVKFDKKQFVDFLMKSWGFSGSYTKKKLKEFFSN